MSIWKTKKLGEVIKLEYGKPLPKESREEGGKYPAYGANGVKCWSNQYCLDRPSIIVGRKGSAGEVNLTEEKFWPLDVTYFVTYDDTQYDLTFLYHCLKHLRLTKLAKGVKPGINRNDVYQIEFAFPPLPEQKRIVAILDEAFEGIDSAIANTEKNLANSREIFESYLNTIFTQKGDGWVEKKLGDTEIIQIIDGDRGTNYPQKSDFSSEGHCLFLNTKNVRSDGFSFDSTMFITEEKDKLLRKGKLKRRDVILTTRGTIGNIAIYDDSVKFEHIRINSGMLIFRPNEKIIKSEYLFEILRSSILKSQIKKFTSGAAQPQLPIKTLVSFSFPVPTSLEEQSRIISNLHELQTETQRLETIYRQKLAALKELKQSILQKAFTGELTADTSKTVKEKIAA
jgi:type I restriction enzyme S subunit